MRKNLWIVMFITLQLVLVSCGGSGGQDSVSAENLERESIEEPEPEPEPEQEPEQESEQEPEQEPEPEPEPENNPPVITLEAGELRVGETARLTILTSDPEGDESTISYSLSKGDAEIEYDQEQSLFISPGEDMVNKTIRITIEVTDSHGMSSTAEFSGVVLEPKVSVVELENKIVAVDRNNDTVFGYKEAAYIGENNKIVRSINRGDSWNVVYTIANENDNTVNVSIVTSPYNSGHVIARIVKIQSINDVKIIQSYSSGEDWEELRYMPSAFMGNPKELLAFNDEGRLVRTLDGGSSWSLIGETEGSYGSTQLLISDVNQDVVYKVNKYDGARFEVSLDGGDSFSNRSNGLPVGPFNFFNMIANPNNEDSVIVFADPEGIYFYTENQGAVWEEWVGNRSSSTPYPYVKRYDDTLYRRSNTDLIEKSTDFGKSWQYGYSVGSSFSEFYPAGEVLYFNDGEHGFRLEIE